MAKNKTTDTDDNQGFEAKHAALGAAIAANPKELGYGG